MKEILLAKYGEIILKGSNRRVFEDALLKNIRAALRPAGKFSCSSAQSTIYIEPADDDADIDDALERLRRVFGIAAIARSRVVEKDIKKISAAAAEYLRDSLLVAKTFKVESRRSDKAFPLKSPEISCEVGGDLCEAFPNLTVDVHDPELTVRVEVRDFAAYVHADSIPGAGGMPVGTGGKAALLLSGGIDSPVAGWMMAKRGVTLEAVHFFSYPYTSERAKEKVIELTKLLTPWCGRIRLHVVPFTAVQEAIRDNCPEEYFTLIMRRFMMRIAKRVAKRRGCDALITGESLGQVASQTMKAIAVTEAVCGLPVFRPLIGMDKEEIVTVARRIGTFETSILPYEDCCTVFTPRHPKTQPEPERLVEAESPLDIDGLVAEAARSVETIVIEPETAAL